MLHPEIKNEVCRLEATTGTPHPYAWLYVYRVYRDIYQQTAQFDKCEMFCDRMDSVSSGTANTFEARAFIYWSRNEYDRALEMADKT